MSPSCACLTRARGYSAPAGKETEHGSFGEAAPADFPESKTLDESLGSPCVKRASQSSAARRRRKQVKSFFRRRVRRENTLPGASVKSPAYGGRMRRRAQGGPFGGKGVSLFRRSQTLDESPGSFFYACPIYCSRGLPRAGRSPGIRRDIHGR